MTTPTYMTLTAALAELERTDPTVRVAADRLDDVIASIVTRARASVGEPVLFRTGRTVGRTIYVQLGPEPADTDPIIGLVDTALWAQVIVEAVNSHFARLMQPPKE